MFVGYQFFLQTILRVKLQKAKWGRDQISCKRATQAAAGGKTQNTNWADRGEWQNTKDTEERPGDADYCLSKRRLGLPKRMNFLKCSKRPPFIFGKSYCGFHDKIATKLQQKCVCSL